MQVILGVMCFFKCANHDVEIFCGNCSVNLSYVTSILFALVQINRKTEVKRGICPSVILFFIVLLSLLIQIHMTHDTSHKLRISNALRSRVQIPPSSHKFIVESKTKLYICLTISRYHIILISLYSLKPLFMFFANNIVINEKNQSRFYYPFDFFSYLNIL